MFLSEIDRKYDEAVKILNSLQPKPEVMKQRIQDKTRDLYEDLKDMYEFMERTSISHDDLNKLGVIHISGTKGKGSTSAYCESILRHQGFKTGFYSSPHLMEVRERFRVNGKPVSKERFCQMFWLVYNRLCESKEKYGGNMPRVFSFNTLLACHIFREEQVDAFIMEVGIGGEYDQTNIVQKPTVCGVTSLDLDHTDVLGNTIESIAWHKAGIFKYSTPAVTSPQIEKAMEVLKNRSIERQCPLFASQPLAEEYDHLLTIRGPKQCINAGLALQICKIWNLKRQDSNASLIDMKITDKTYGVPVLNSSALTPVEIKGLSECKWYGRNQVVKKPGITYYLDGAHTNDSMEQCATWFKATSNEEKESIRGRVVKILYFNVTGERNVPSLISYLKPCNFDVVAFSPNKRYSDINRNRADEFELSNNDEMKQIQSQKCKTEWDKVCVPRISCSKNTDLGSGHNESSGAFSEYFPCITDALMWITQGRDEIINSVPENPLPPAPSIITKDTHLQILVTGSLHLVGGVLIQICPGLND